ncbi:hypothetical protein CMO83_05490 [Candidatus Woesearchaeota archaeon]|nr:hypothetical protein [Candidatus Woesearchaeota archaeon]
MNKEVFKIVKDEVKYIGILLVAALIIFKIVYFKENLIVIFRSVISLFWLFVLPGYIIMLYWREKLGFTERFVIGIGLSAAVIGIFSYYFGLLGLNIKYHGVLLPIILILIGIIINLRK